MDEQEGHEWIVELNLMEKRDGERGVVRDALSGVYCMWSPARSRSSREYRNPLQASVGFVVRCEDREYSMIYKEPGFFAVVWFGPSTSPPSVGKLSLFSKFCLCVAGRAYWRERGEGMGGGAKSNYSEKAWSSIIILWCKGCKTAWSREAYLKLW